MFPETNHYQWVVSGKGEYEEVSGGANGTRTRNPLLAKQVRYQLRHGPFRERSSDRVGSQSTGSVTSAHAARSMRAASNLSHAV